MTTVSLEAMTFLDLEDEYTGLYSPQVMLWTASYVYDGHRGTVMSADI
jgi:hypothetical protein